MPTFLPCWPQLPQQGWEEGGSALFLLRKLVVGLPKVVNTLPSNAEGAGSIPDWGAKIPYAPWPGNQDINNISNIVTNSIKT